MTQKAKPQGQGQGLAHSASEIDRQPVLIDGIVNVGSALVYSPVTWFFGRSYPVQFRAHGDRWSQYVSMKYSERLADAGIEPSVGRKGNSHVNAWPRRSGLYMAELIPRAPWKTLRPSKWPRCNVGVLGKHHRLLEPLGYIPPAEAEANYDKQLSSQAVPA